MTRHDRKRCPQCQSLRSVLSYNRDDARPDGLAPYCIRCSRSYHRADYARSREAGSSLYVQAVALGASGGRVRVPSPRRWPKEAA